MSDRTNEVRYLEARGWLGLLSLPGTLVCPISGDRWNLDAALTIQRARDAVTPAEERRAWVRFAAATLASPNAGSGPLLATHADDMLDEFRKRFGSAAATPSVECHRHVLTHPAESPCPACVATAAPEER